MRTSLALLVLSLFHVAVFASPDKYLPIHVRQTTGSTADPQCLDYSVTANLSTIGANSSYRAAFIQSSPQGTFQVAAVLNAAIAKLPALTKNATLNKACGNLTTVAFVEAEKNYTKGVVAQFTGIKPTTIEAGIEVAVIVAFVVFSICGVAMFAP